ncbi:MAG TPA: DMT family transporter, partial [Vicinamibacterales bacterium]|nr:DMT family transporter [Vicinamibacterales bacterium]
RPPLAVAGAVFPLAAIGLAPLLLVSDLRWLTDPRGIAVALHLGVVATAVAYVLFSTGLQRIPGPTAVTLSLAEPLTAAALGAIVLGERPGAAALAGAGLVLAGLALLALPRGREAR